ncbi:hypothetical protein [Peribacillus glennii]|nr:hypothetical protein [Peribacillus glennii]
MLLMEQPLESLLHKSTAAEVEPIHLFRKPVTPVISDTGIAIIIISR